MDLDRWYWYRSPRRPDTLGRLKALAPLIRHDGGGVGRDVVTLAAGCRLWCSELQLVADLAGDAGPYDHGNGD